MSQQFEEADFITNVYNLILTFRVGMVGTQIGSASCSSEEAAWPPATK
jgi:hypothetical protein